MKAVFCWRTLPIALAFAWACSQSDSTGDVGATGGSSGSDASASGVTSASLGPEGGVLKSADGVLTVSVPEGALEAPITLTVGPLSGAPAGYVVGPYALEPTGTQFKLPVQLTFDVALAGAKVSTAGLRLATLDNGAWTPVSPPIVDASGKRVGGLTSHLSPYSLGLFPCVVVGSETKCAFAHEQCVRAPAPDSYNFCALPCRSDSDCPTNLYCTDNACVWRACWADVGEVCPREGEVCWGTGGRCLSKCTSPQTCPAGTHPSASVNGQWACGFVCVPTGCLSDLECGSAAYCLRKANSETEFGWCVSGTLGCDCSDPTCPCAPSGDGGVGGNGGASEAGPDVSTGSCSADSECPAGSFCCGIDAYHTGGGDCPVASQGKCLICDGVGYNNCYPDKSCKNDVGTCTTVGNGCGDFCVY